MKAYVISFRRYNQATIEMMQPFGQLYISRLTNRLCVTVRVSEEDKERLIAELGARGYSPEWNVVFENQSA